MSADPVARLGEVLRETGFDGDRGVALRRVPPEALLTLGRRQDLRLAVLVSLFAGDRVIACTQAAQALAPVALDALLDAGLLEGAGAGVRRRVSLPAGEGLILAGDLPARRGAAGYVAPMSPASRTLARLAAGRTGGTVLDLGTGAGALALGAARRAERAVGVDVNPRALSYARLNQRLNGIANITWREGDWFEPVRGERFDLVLVDPPCAVPSDGLHVDGLSRRIVGEAAKHLSDGGYAIVLCTWAHPEGDWQAPLRGWVTDLGCDALLLRTGSQDALHYAISCSELLVADAGRRPEAVDRWARRFARSKVERVGRGAVVLRRRRGSGSWTRAFELDHDGPSGAAGRQLERIFAGCDFLASAGAQRREGLLASAWRLVDGHRLDQALLYEDGAYASGAARARQEPGLNLSTRLDTRVVGVVAGCDGRRALRDLLQAHHAPEGLDAGGFHGLCLAAVEDLIARGFLVGAPLPGDSSAAADDPAPLAGG